MLLLQQSHCLIPHALLFLGVEAQRGGEYVLLCPHMLCDKHVIEYRKAPEQADILEGTGYAQLGYLVRSRADHMAELWIKVARVQLFHLALGMVAYHGLTHEAHLAVGRLIYAGYAVESRSLSCAVGTYEGNYLLVVYLH